MNTIATSTMIANRFLKDHASPQGGMDENTFRWIYSKTYFGNLNPLRPPPQKKERNHRGIHALFGQAVELRMRSDVPVGAFLSGGMDSASLVSIASKMNPNFEQFRE